MKIEKTLLVVLLLACPVALLCRADEGACVGCPEQACDKVETDAGCAQAWRDQWGVEIASLRMSAAGYMVDFRYKVIDAKKAGILAKEEIRPVLIDAATGEKLYVPRTKIGPMRQTAVQVTPGVIYTTLFANPVQAVKAGSKVTIVVGDCRLENLTVE